MYYKLNKEILENKSISSTSKLLYSVIDGLTDNQPTCNASNKYLSACLGIKERQLQNCLKELQEQGLIEIDYSLGIREMFISKKLKKTKTKKLIENLLT
jgi:Mn-dependent DtxR family transcriptional regulator